MGLPGSGPTIGALIAVGIAYILRGRGGGESGTRAAQGTLGIALAAGAHRQAAARRPTAPRPDEPQAGGDGPRLAGSGGAGSGGPGPAGPGPGIGAGAPDSGTS